VQSLEATSAYREDNDRDGGLTDWCIDARLRAM